MISLPKEYNHDLAGVHKMGIDLDPTFIFE